MDTLEVVSAIYFASKTIEVRLLQTEIEKLIYNSLLDPGRLFLYCHFLCDLEQGIFRKLQFPKQAN